MSARNRTLSNNLDVRRSPVASAASALYLEAGYDILPWLAERPGERLDLFVRLDDYDTMAEVPEGFFDNPRFDRRVLTVAGAVAALRENPGDATLGAACEAWIAARLPWEASEGFLFGPVDFNGYDPALDTWPVNRTDLEGVIALRNDALDRRLKGEIRASIDEIGRISNPFRDAIASDAAQIEKAQRAIAQVQRTFEEEVLPLVLAQ